MQTECRESNNFTKRSKVHFKLELKEGKQGNLLVIVKFDPEASNFFIAGLYYLRTLRLFAFGRSVVDIHQRCVKASFTRILSILTHCAGLGNLAGLCQINC